MAPSANSSSDINNKEYSVIYPVQDLPSFEEIPETQQPLLPTPDQVATKRYATSVDERNFLTVYEYMVNGQWVIWDYHTGYVHLTGLWKAIGNSKADIVKLVDNSPHLEPVIRRVRGGFLKIQGTWLPFPVAKTLAARTCYHIRYALIPVFGPAFPSSCLTPDQPGFGQLQLNTAASGSSAAAARRRARRRSSSGMTANNTTTTKVSKQQQPNNASTKRRRNTDSGPRQRRGSSNGLLGSGNLTRPPPLVGDENAICDSSSEEDFEDDFAENYAYTRRKLSQFSLPPPPLPHKISLTNDSTTTDLLDSPSEFAQVLQATRSLQRISAGSAGRRWSTSNLDLGGGFECGGKLWRWDGDNRLKIIGYTNSNSSNDNDKNKSDIPRTSTTTATTTTSPPVTHRVNINDLLI